MRNGPYSKIGLLVGAVLLASIALPRVVSAVGSLVTIEGGGSDNKARVDEAGQLLTGEAAPGSFAEFSASFIGSTGGCQVVASAPDTKAFVAKQVVLHFSREAAAGNHFVLYRNGTCSGPSTGRGAGEILRASAPERTVYTIPFEPGFAVAAGDSLSAQVGGDMNVFVYVTGYFVPKSAVPETTKVR